jgi:plasmid stabilization system protein ParE
MGVGRREVVWVGAAARALNDAVAFVAKDSPKSARQILDRALEAAESLATLDDRGRVVCLQLPADLRDS